jgi:hypothetical protein
MKLKHFTSGNGTWTAPTNGTYVVTSVGSASTKATTYNVHQQKLLAFLLQLGVRSAKKQLAFGGYGWGGAGGSGVVNVVSHFQAGQKVILTNGSSK